MFSVGDTQDWRKQLANIKVRNLESTWHSDKVNALKMVIEHEFKNVFTYESFVLFDETKDKNGVDVLNIKIVTKDYGFIETDISLAWILSPEIPHDFPKKLRIKAEEIFVEKINRTFKKVNEKPKKPSTKKIITKETQERRKKLKETLKEAKTNE